MFTLASLAKDFNNFAGTNVLTAIKKKSARILIRPLSGPELNRLIQSKRTYFRTKLTPFVQQLKNIQSHSQPPDAWTVFFTDCLRVSRYLVGPFRDLCLNL